MHKQPLTFVHVTLQHISLMLSLNLAPFDIKNCRLLG